MIINMNLPLYISDSVQSLVTDLEGRIVENIAKIGSITYRIDLSRVSMGIYFLIEKPTKYYSLISC